MRWRELRWQTIEIDACDGKLVGLSNEGCRSMMTPMLRSECDGFNTLATRIGGRERRRGYRILIIKDGFAITSSVFRAGDLASISNLLNVEDRSRAGRRHLLTEEPVRALANDPRLIALAREAIGESVMPFKATLFDKSRTANWLVVWHQDVSLPIRARVEADGWGPWSVKRGQLYAHAPAAALEQVVALRIHLDDSTSDNGPLRVLPGTHALGRLSEDRIRELARQIRAVECTTQAGGVVTMRPLIVHASSKSRNALPRRVLHIEYSRGVELGSNLQLAVA